MEVADELTVAGVPTPAGTSASACRGLYLDAPPAACGAALLQPGPGARGAPPLREPEAPCPLCPVPPRALQLDHRPGTSGENRECAHRPGHDHSGHGRLGEYAPDGY